MKTLRALVVYESMFGNTEQLARAVAAGIAGRPRQRHHHGGERCPVRRSAPRW